MTRHTQHAVPARAISQLPGASFERLEHAGVIRAHDKLRHRVAQANHAQQVGAKRVISAGAIAWHAMADR